MASWLDNIDAQKNYDYVVFDCPPATKIVSQNALAASDSYVIPVILGERGDARAAPSASSRILPAINEAELRNASLDELEKIVTDAGTARKDLEFIAIQRFSVPRGSMRRFSDKQMLVDKLRRGSFRTYIFRRITLCASFRTVETPAFRVFRRSTQLLCSSFLHVLKPPLHSLVTNGRMKR